MKAVVLSAVIASVCAGQVLAAPAPGAGGYDPHDLSGVWMQSTRPPVGPYPLTPEYAEILKKRMDAIKAGKPAEANPCVPGPIVRMMTFPTSPLEIAHIHDDRIIVTKENGSIFRIYLKRPHKDPEDLTQGLYGDAVGHWEGDTLVVDTIGLGGSAEIEGVTPHSDAMHVIQRLRRTDANTLEDRMTVEDSKAFTAPVNVTILYTSHPDWELGEFFCTNERMSVDNDGRAVINPPQK
jgi:hypothetical protein